MASLSQLLTLITTELGRELAMLFIFLQVPPVLSLEQMVAF